MILFLINLESPEENSYLISCLKDPKIFGDNNFDRLPQEASNRILQSINQVIKLQLGIYNQTHHNIFYVRNYQDGRVIKFLRPECKDLIMDAVKQNQSIIAEAFKANIDKSSGRIIDKNVDDLSDQDFNNLLKSQEVILIDLDKPQNNQRLIALLRNKNIFGEQNLDKLSPALKIAFLNNVNEILKTSLELYAQESAGANPFYVRKYQDGTKAKFLKYEHFNLIDKIIDQNKELIAKSIKSILQQSTSQSSPTQPRVLKTKSVSSSSPIQPKVLKTTPVKELIGKFENRQSVQETSSTSPTASSQENITPRGSISPEIAKLREIFETNSSNSPSNVVVSPRSFRRSQSSTNQKSLE